MAITSPYTSVSSPATYKDGSPADDGSQVAANRIVYSNLVADLTDPLEDFCENINTNVVTAFATWGTITDTDAGAAAGPTLTLHRDSASPADADFIAEIDFDGEDDGSTQTTYASIAAQIDDVTDATEDGSLLINTMQAGTLTKIMDLSTLVQIITANAGDFVTIESTEAGANAGPGLTLYRNSASPADADALGTIKFDGEDDGGNQTTYASIEVELDDVTGGTEDGSLLIKTMEGGSLTTQMDISSAAIVLAAPLDINGLELFLDADADTSITADTDDQIDFKVGGTDTLQLAAPATSEEWTKTGSGRMWHFVNSHASTPSAFLIDFSAAAPDNNTQYFFLGQDNATARVYIYSDGDLANHDGTYGMISDDALKTGFKLSNSQWDDVKALAAKIGQFQWKSDLAVNENAPWLLGWKASDVKAISPGLVKSIKWGDEMRDSVMLSVANIKLFKAVGEMMERIEALEAA